MILPIVAYGTPVLRSVAKEITPDYPNLDKFIADMWETLYASSGVGLAAPQVNKNIRLFIVDSMQLFANQEEEDKGKYPDEPGFKKIFINHFEYPSFYLLVINFPLPIPDWIDLHDLHLVSAFYK